MNVNKYIKNSLIVVISGINFVAKTAFAVDWEPIRKKYSDVIVYIQVEGKTQNELPVALSGTGFIIHPDGYVLTCNHVIPEITGASISQFGSVGGRNEHRYPISIVYRDSQSDLMLLKLPEKPLPWAFTKIPDQISKPNEILAFGFPIRMDLITVPGSITGSNDNGRWVTNAALNPGMSGGPIFNENGFVAAMVSSGIPEAQGLNFVIPISFAQSLLQKLPAGFNIPVTPKNASDSEAFLTASVKDFAELLPWAQGYKIIPQMSREIWAKRNSFKNAWNAASFTQKLALPQVNVSNAFLAEFYICRAEERSSGDRPLSHKVASEMIEFFQNKQDQKEWLLQAYLAKIVTYNDQIQLQLNNSKRESLLRDAQPFISSATDLLASIENSSAKSVAEAKLIMIKSIFCYENAKPNEVKEEKQNNWNVENLNLSYELANQVVLFEPDASLVQRLRSLRQLAGIDFDKCKGALNKEINTNLSLIDKALQNSGTDITKAVPILNNFALVIHEVCMLDENKSSIILPTNPSGRVAVHQQYALRLQERVVALANDSPEFSAQKGNFQMDLAKMYAFQATLLNISDENTEKISLLSKMDDALLWISNDELMSLTMRKKLARQASAAIEFAPYRSRAALKPLDMYIPEIVYETVILFKKDEAKTRYGNWNIFETKLELPKFYQTKEVNIPKGARVVKKEAWWDTNGNESRAWIVDVTETESKVTAKGGIAVNAKPGGPGTEGVFRLRVTVEVPKNN